MAFHTSLLLVFLSSLSLSMPARTTLWIVMFTPLNASCCYSSFLFLLSTPKITQPFPLVGHDIDDYRTTVMHM